MHQIPCTSETCQADQSIHYTPALSFQVTQQIVSFELGDWLHQFYYVYTAIIKKGLFGGSSRDVQDFKCTMLAHARNFLGE